MTIGTIINELEKIAPLSLQESYDNAGLITGETDWNCTGILITLDSIEAVVDEAIHKKCNLIVAHHPIVFKGLKKITVKNYIGRTIIKAIKHDIAIYAIHTNLDNVIAGVNGKIAEKLGLKNLQVLSAQQNILQKLVVFVPSTHQDIVENALFEAGAGNIGNYTNCSFVSEGIGGYQAGEGAKPFLGKIGKRHIEKEVKVEVIFPKTLQKNIVAALRINHPYEEVAFDIFSLENQQSETGSGIIGVLEKPISAIEMLEQLQNIFNISCIKHTHLLEKPIQKVAICGGAGSFLTNNAIASKADIYISSDIKYHEFFDADGKILLVDIGHYESEQFTQDLLFDILREKFPNFAVLKTEVNTNPVEYFTSVTNLKNK